MNIERELEKSKEDILNSFERKQHSILTNIEKTKEYDLLIKYLFVVSEICNQKNQHYFIAVNVIDVYIQFFKNRKSQGAAYKISLEEGKLVNILFKSCMLAKRYNLAKTMLEIAGELDIEISDDKGYIRQLNANSFKFKKRIIVRFIYGTLFFVSLSFIEQTMTNVIILTFLLTTIEILIAYIATKYKGF
ncbi:hypothetical protein [Bernardetia sp.]|uniref:hypothetical protein n=1 Tax=Bernardetia sp. TaxID=1937974 RepID=UPI0025BABC2A|nr:hypothetical protein [Bernardetia sp.]